MERNRKLICVTVCMLIFLISNAYARNTTPYSIRGEISNASTQANQKYEFKGVFSNDSSKEVSSFTIVFFVFDQDGNSPLRGRNNVVIKIEEKVPAYENFDFVKNLDEYFYNTSDFYEEDNSVSDDELEYECEYLYVSLITYSDGTEWSDPFGFEAF